MTKSRQEFVELEIFVKKDVSDTLQSSTTTNTILLSNNASKFEDDTKYHLDLEIKTEDSTAEHFELGNGTAQLFLNTDQGTKIEVLTAVDEAEFFDTTPKSEPLDGDCNASQHNFSLTTDNNTIKMEMIENQQPAAWEASCPEFCFEPLKTEPVTNEDMKNECVSVTNSGLTMGLKTEPVECKPFQCDLYQDSADLSSSSRPVGHGHYLTFIGGRAPLPDPASLPTTGDVLRYLSYSATPTLTGTPLLHHVAQTLLDTYCCSDSHKTLVK